MLHHGSRLGFLTDFSSGHLVEFGFEDHLDCELQYFVVWMDWLIKEFRESLYGA